MSKKIFFIILNTLTALHCINENKHYFQQTYKSKYQSPCRGSPVFFLTMEDLEVEKF